MSDEFYEVENFTYNGLFIKATGGIATYKAKPLRWNELDCGIMICECTDGKERNIPTCQLNGYTPPKRETVPQNVLEMRKTLGAHIGAPSHS
jgi:hypothetical protein